MSEILRDVDKAAQGIGPCAITVGAFDGVHPGHRALLNCLSEASQESGLPAVVLTFDPHPQVVLRGSEFKCLTTVNERLALLSSAGVDYVVVLPFDKALARTPAGQFIEEIVVGKLRARTIVSGPNHYFGAGREGSVELLWQMGPLHGFQVILAEPVVTAGDRLSSSRIREVLNRRGVEEAAELLGRPYSVRGRVVFGAGRGVGLGYPTANLSLDPVKLIPAEGVYAGRAFLPGQEGAPLGGEELGVAMVNVGLAPTFGRDEVVVEAHILDHDMPLYGEILEVSFEMWVRPERRFALRDDLVAQIGRDIETVRGRVGRGLD